MTFQQIQERITGIIKAKKRPTNNNDVSFTVTWRQGYESESLQFSLYDYTLTKSFNHARPQDMLDDWWRELEGLASHTNEHIKNLGEASLASPATKGDTNVPRS